MRRIIIAISVCLTLLIFCPLSINAADELLGCVPDGLTVMDIGDIIECDINPVADSDIFEFFGIDGDEIRLTLTDQTGGGPAPCLELLDPDAQPIDNWCAQTVGVSHQIALVKTGTYRIFVNEANDDQTVVYRIALQRKFPSPPETLTLLFDEVLEDNTIDPVPDSDVFIFDGTPNDTIRLTLTDRTGGGPAPCLELLDPDAQPIDNWCAQTVGVSREFVLEKNGTYTILVYEANDDQVVTYNLALQCLSGDIGGCSDQPSFNCGGLDATIIGTEGDNVIIGTDGKDVIVGGGGNDIIYGLGGNDRICGERGDDIIYGGIGRDRLFGGSGNDVLYGNFGPDVLRGGDGNDTLAGSKSDDELIGESGVDVCDGGTHDTGDTADDTCEAIVNVEILP